MAELIRKVGISEQTYYRRKEQYKDMEVDQVRELKQLHEENAGWNDIVVGIVPCGTTERRMAAVGAVVMMRSGLMADYQRGGVVPTAEDPLDYSMWRGYLSEPSQAEMLVWLRAGGSEIDYIHTSGHASSAHLRPFAAAIRPKATVPVHGMKWDEESQGFDTSRRLADAETMVVR